MARDAFIKNLDISQYKIMFCKRFDQNSPIWNLERHSHAYFEMLFFLRGNAKIEAGGRLLSPAAYDMVAYAPGHAHQETIDLQKNQEVVCVWVDMGEGRFMGNGSLYIRDRSRILEWLFIRLEEEYRSAGPYRERLLACYLEAVFLNMQRFMNEPSSDGAAEAATTAQAYIAAHFTERVQVEYIAALCHVSASYLHRVFKKQTGVSPLQYALNLRLKKAEELLHSTSLTLAEIANHCGFEDPGYFSRAFKKKMGLPPGAYREKGIKTD
ncbi:AraC family transcriptional regulator [Christensenellaceae bacterium OttesenSCG-928-M15]|nr:AraC family transcriptional regulator [Christensenellaceae bacterium OttesenSCG-928-M15]